MKDIKQKQVECKIKSTMSKVENILDGINSRLDIA